MKPRSFIRKDREKEWEQHVVSAPINCLLDVAIHAMEMASTGNNKADLIAYFNQCKLSKVKQLHVKDLVEHFSPRGEELFGKAA